MNFTWQRDGALLNRKDASVYLARATRGWTFVSHRFLLEDTPAEYKDNVPIEK